MPLLHLSGPHEDDVAGAQPEALEIDQVLSSPGGGHKEHEELDPLRLQQLLRDTRARSSDKVINSTPMGARPRSNFFFGARYNEGNLAFKDGNPEYEAVKLASSRVPTIVTVYLDRPAVLTAVKDKATAILANFGVSDAALFEVLTGKRQPEGRKTALRASVVHGGG